MMSPTEHEAHRVKSKKERLQWLVDQVGEALGIEDLKVVGSADAMLVTEVRADGTIGHPFGHVRRPAAEILTAMRFVLMAIARKEVG